MFHVGLLIARGLFSVKDSYLYDQKARMEITSGLTPQEWKKIRRLKIQLRLKMMIWKVSANALPIRSATRTSNGILCPFCQESEEAPEQLFLGCPISLAVWRQGPWHLNFRAFGTLPIQQWICFILKPCNFPRPNCASWPQIMLTISITLDSIWGARNKLVHEGHIPVMADLPRLIQRHYAAHLLAWEVTTSSLSPVWHPPLEGSLKINFDVALKTGNLCGAAVCRNSSGAVLKVSIAKTTRCEVLKGEAWAAHRW